MIFKTHIKELYISGSPDIIDQIKNSPVCVIVQKQGEDTFFMGLCFGETWENNNRFCACSINFESFLDSAMICLTPRNEYSVYAYAVVMHDFKQDLFLSNIQIDESYFDIQNSPIILNSLESQIIYCSSSNGDDNNMGTINYPFKTIKEALAVGKRIRLKRGDTFYESINLSNKDLGAYGGGVPPIISGLKIAATNSSWEQGKFIVGKWIKTSTGKIWRLKLSANNDFFNGFQTNGSSYDNDIGAIINIEANKPANCRRVLSPQDLAFDFDFYQPVTSSENGITATPEDFDYLYMYYSENPNLLNLGVTVGLNGVFMNNSSIHDVIIENWGNHGIAATYDTIINNCIIRNIGGMVSLGYKNWACLGNGIEFYIHSTCRNSLIRDNHIQNCFDAGFTIQGSSDTAELIATNICFINNVVRECCQGVEDFIRGVGYNSRFYNCVVSNNFFINNGIETGFRYYDNRFKRCGILNNSQKYTGLIISKNRFINGNYFCGSKNSEGNYKNQNLQSNISYIVKGQYLIGNYNGDADIVQIPLSDEASQIEASINEYRRLSEDYTTEFVVFDNQEEMKSFILTHFIPLI